jgi:hypothetical protein
MAELKAAGINDGQRIVLVCPERLTQRTKKRIQANQPGLLRPKQSYGRIARTAVCFNPDAGNCFTANAAFNLRVSELEGEVIVPSLRRDTVGLDPDAGEDADGGEDAVDDAFQYRLDDCRAERCLSFDAGDGSNFCGRLNRLMLVDPPNMIANCFGLPDGGWDDNAGEVGHIPAPNCRFNGPYAFPDAGARFMGCNSLPRQYAIGNACLPVESGVVAGDVPQDWL